MCVKNVIYNPPPTFSLQFTCDNTTVYNQTYTMGIISQVPNATNNSIIADCAKPTTSYSQINETYVNKQLNETCYKK